MSRIASYVTVWLFLVFVTQFSLSAQRLSMQYVDAPLSQVLKDIAQHENVIIAFQEQDVTDFRVTADLRGMTVSASLQLLLDDGLLSFRQLNERQYIISRRLEPTVHARLVAPRTSWNMSGQVLDSQSHQALPLAVVRVPGTQYGTHTDQNGYFVLMDLPLGTDSLEVRYLGYEPFRATISSRQFMLVQMQASDRALEEVTITEGNEQAVSMADAASLLEINPRRVESLSGLGEPDLLRAIQFLPGISSSDESAGGLHIRGGRPEENLILLDGITVYQPGHLFGNFSAFNPHAVKSLTVQRGGFDARYGGRVSGLIDISTRPDQMQKAEGELGLNLLNAHAYGQLPFWNKKGAIMLAVRHSNSGWLDSRFYHQLSSKVIDSLRLANQSSGTPSLDTRPDFRFVDFNTKVVIRPTDRDLLSVSAYAANDYLEYQWTDSISRQEWFSQNEQNYLRNLGASANWVREWNPRLLHKLNVAYSSFDNRFEFRQVYNLFPDPAIGWTQRNRIQDLSVRLDQEWKIDPHHRLDFGVHATHFVMDSLLDFQGDNETAPSFQKNASLASPYLQYQGDFGTRLQLTAGLRTNYYAPTHAWYHEPRLSARYRLHDHLHIKAVWGRFHQFLNRTELGSLAGLVEDYWTLADNGRIPVLASEHWIVGGAYQNDSWLLDVELYRKNTQGLITYRNFDRQQIFQPVLINDGIGLSRGLDVLLQKKVGRYTSWMSYSLSQTTYSFPELLNGQAFAASHDQRHQFSWVNVLELGRWDASLNWTYASGRPYTEVQDVLVNRPLGGELEYSLGFGPLNAARLNAYHRLDANLSYRYDLFQGKSGGKVGVSVFNLYDRQNVQSVTYRVKPPLSKADEPGILRLEKNLLGFTPNVFINLTF